MKRLETKQHKLLEKFEEKRDLILENPLIGKKLKGELRDYRKLDFTMRGISLRICYSFNPEEDCAIQFVWFGTRENFYDEVSRYVN